MRGAEREQGERLAARDLDALEELERLALAAQRLEKVALVPVHLAEIAEAGRLARGQVQLPADVERLLERPRGLPRLPELPVHAAQADQDRGGTLRLVEPAVQ